MNIKFHNYDDALKLHRSIVVRPGFSVFRDEDKPSKRRNRTLNYRRGRDGIFRLVEHPVGL